MAGSACGVSAGEGGGPGCSAVGAGEGRASMLLRRATAAAAAAICSLLRVSTRGGAGAGFFLLAPIKFRNFWVRAASAPNSCAADAPHVFLSGFLCSPVPGSRASCVSGSSTFPTVNILSPRRVVGPVNCGAGGGSAGAVGTTGNCGTKGGNIYPGGGGKKGG